MIELMEEIEVNNRLYKCTQMLEIEGEMIYIFYDLEGKQKIFVRQIENKKYEQIKDKKILKNIKNMITLPSIIKYEN